MVLNEMLIMCVKGIVRKTEEYLNISILILISSTSLMLLRKRSLNFDEVSSQSGFNVIEVCLNF